MFRIKIKLQRKGNISIGVLIILGIVLSNLIIITVAIANVYKGTKLWEIQVYSNDKANIERNVENKKIEDVINFKINELINNMKIEKTDDNIKQALKGFYYSDDRYFFGFDYNSNHFFLDEHGRTRKYLDYFIKEGVIILKTRKS